MKNALLRTIFHLGYLFRVVEVKTPEQRKAFHALWSKVWEEEGYAHYGEPLPEVERHYALFDSCSTDLVLYFGFTPIGTIRLIWDNPQTKTPLLNDFEVKKVWSGKVVETTLLTIRKDWRGRFHHLPSLILWRELYQRAKRNNMEGILMAADVRVWHLLKKFFPFHQIGKEKLYEGSTTVPAYLSIAEADEVVTKTQPILASFFLA